MYNNARSRGGSTTPLNQPLGRLKQEDHKFQNNPGYIMRSFPKKRMKRGREEREKENDRRKKRTRRKRKRTSGCR